MALALTGLTGLTPQPLSTSIDSDTLGGVKAQLPPPTPLVPLPLLSSPPSAPSSSTGPSAPSAPCPSQPTSPTRYERPLPPPPTSPTNSRASTPPPLPHKQFPGGLLDPRAAVPFPHSKSQSSFVTDDSSDAMDDFDLREQLCGSDWQRYPPHKAPAPPAQTPSPVPSSFDIHDDGSSRCSRASFDEDALPEQPYVDGFSTYIHPSLRKQSKHTKSSSSGAHPDRTTSRRAAHLRRSKSASNFASMFPSDEAPPPVPPLPIHSPTITQRPISQRSPVVPAIMMKGSCSRSPSDKGLNGALPPLPSEVYAVNPPPLPPKHPDLPKSSSAELVSINEAAAMAVRRRTRSGPQAMPLSTAYHGNMNRSVDAPPRLHTTKHSLPSSPRQSHRRAHSVQHSIGEMIPEFTLPGRSASRQSLKDSISSPAPVLPDKLAPSSYHAPYASTRAAPSPPLKTPVFKRPPLTGLRTPPPPPEPASSMSGHRPLPPLPGVPIHQATTSEAALPRSFTLPSLTSLKPRSVSMQTRLSILKNSRKGKQEEVIEPPSPGSLAKQQALAWRKAVHDEAIAALREAETWEWPVPPSVPALERSMSVSTCSASPTKSLAELAGEWEAANASSLMIELDSQEHDMQRNNSSTFSSDLGPVTPDESDDRNPFDAFHKKPVAMVVTAPPESSSPRSVTSYGVPF